jgi:hypothetical protein
MIATYRPIDVMVALLNGGRESGRLESAGQPGQLTQGSRYNAALREPVIDGIQNIPSVRTTRTWLILDEMVGQGAAWS